MSPPAENTTQLDRASGINFLRVFAAFLVVAAHCTSPYFHNPPDGMSFSWGWVTVLLSWLATSVPLFFLLAGFALLRPGLQAIPFYKRRIHKLLVPLLSWSAIYLVMRIALEGNRISIPSAFRLIYNGEVYVHLWFLYVILGVYLALPILSPLADRKHKVILIWFAGIAIMLSSILPFFDQVLTQISGFTFKAKLPASFFPISLCYVVIGALARDFHLGPKGLRWALFGFILSLLFTVIATCVNAVSAGKPSSVWMDLWQPGVVGSSICLFLLMKGMPVSPGISRNLRHLSNWSFGLYISHPLIIKLISLTSWKSSSNPALGIPVNTIIVLLASILLVALLSKLPFLRRIV